MPRTLGVRAPSISAEGQTNGPDHGQQGSWAPDLVAEPQVVDALVDIYHRIVYPMCVSDRAYPAAVEMGPA